MSSGKNPKISELKGDKAVSMEKSPSKRAGPSDDPVLRKLKDAYDEVAQEPFPEYLLDLLEKLEEAEKKR